jgi:hypothetical protein
VDDPKVQRLPPPLFKAWINCMCIAKQNGGVLPPAVDIAFKLRVSEVHAKDLVNRLRAAELIDERDGQLEMHNWNGRQFNSDGSAERMRRHRMKQKESHSDGGSDDDVTSHVTESDAVTETGHMLRYTEQNRTEQIQTPSPNVTKLSFGKFDNVLLKQSEHESLCVKFGAVKANEHIESLSEYVASKGKKYKSHYATILTWDRMKNPPPPEEPKGYVYHG